MPISETQKIVIEFDKRLREWNHAYCEYIEDNFYNEGNKRCLDIAFKRQNEIIDKIKINYHFKK